MVIRLTEEFLEEPIASLEQHGLELRTVADLENYYGLYGHRTAIVRHLQNVTDKDLLRISSFGLIKVRQVKKALLSLYREMVSHEH